VAQGEGPNFKPSTAKKKKKKKVKGPSKNKLGGQAMIPTDHGLMDFRARRRI
jgi:hypothetical protein